MISLIKTILGRYWWIGLAIIVFYLAVNFAIKKTREIDAEINAADRKIEAVTAQLKEANDVIRQMHNEHEIALEVANQALRERVEIYEKARERICRAEEVMGNNTNFCEQLIPDDLSRLWEAPAAGNNDSNQNNNLSTSE